MSFGTDSEDQKSDLRAIFEDHTSNWKIMDYVAGWFMKAAQFGTHTRAATAFVATNSICQGQQVPTLWPLIFDGGHDIDFAYPSFKWSNLASHNAGVTVVIVGISSNAGRTRRLFSILDTGELSFKEVDNINAYLAPADDIYVKNSSKPVNGLPSMDYGSKPADGGGLVVKSIDYHSISDQDVKRFIKPYLGSDEYIDGKKRYCLWIDAQDYEDALGFPFLRDRLDAVRQFRRKSSKAKTREQAETPYAFSEVRHGKSSELEIPLIIPIHTSEMRNYLPVGALARGTVVSNAAFGLYDAPLWNMALIASRLHLVWIATVCGKIKTDFRYSNTLGWNTFPVPTLTDKNKADLTRCVKDILLARETHFPATIADLYDPETMPADLRAAHERNDEVLERIYIGRRFKNDTERLAELFKRYTEMTAGEGQTTKRKARAQ